MPNQQGDAIRLGDHRLNMLTGVNAIRIIGQHRIQQHLLQIGAMNMQVGSMKAQCRKRDSGDIVAAAPVNAANAFGHAAHFHQGLLQAKRRHHRHGIRTKL